jgi:hypothetical protein
VEIFTPEYEAPENKFSRLDVLKTGENRELPVCFAPKTG